MENPHPEREGRKAIPIGDLQPGMEVACDLVDERGHNLLSKGQIMQVRFIKRLEMLGLKEVFVETELPECFTRAAAAAGAQAAAPEAKYTGLWFDVPNVLTEETRQAAASMVRQTLTDARLGRQIDSDATRSAVERIVDEIIASQGTIAKLFDIKDYDEYTFSHSINTCVIFTTVAMHMGYSKAALLDLGDGVLLHDIGKINISEKILSKPDCLTAAEFEIVKNHPEFGYRMLEESGGFSEKALNVVFHHHERFDGSGYPRSLNGDEIDIDAQLLSVIDVYDALTTDRVYRKKLFFYEAVKLIIGGAKSLFNDFCVRQFLEVVGIYPVGTWVMLNTNQFAVVVETNKRRLLSPKVMLLTDASGRRLEEPFKADLSSDPKLFVTRVVDEDEVR